MTRSTTTKAEVSKNTIIISLEELKDILQKTVKEQTEVLITEIQILKQEITDLRESNIEMVRMLTHHPASLLKNNLLESEDLDSSTLSGHTIVETLSQSVEKEKIVRLDSNYSKVPHQQTYSRRGRSRNTERPKKIVLGTGTNEHEQKENVADEFGNFASTRRLWIYVGRCKPTSTPEDIKKYLEKRSPGHEFNVTKLNSQGRNSSYRVEADVELENNLYTPSYWPKGVIVKKFQFRNTGYQDREF